MQSQLEVLIDIVVLLTSFLQSLVILQLNNQENQYGLQFVKINLDLIRRTYPLVLYIQLR